MEYGMNNTRGEGGNVYTKDKRSDGIHCDTNGRIKQKVGGSARKRILEPHLPNLVFKQARYRSMV